MCVIAGGANMRVVSGVRGSGGGRERWCYRHGRFDYIVSVPPLVVYVSAIESLGLVFGHGLFE